MLLAAAPRKRRRLIINARKLSVFKQLFEGSDDEDQQKIERLLERLSGIDKRIQVLRQEEITDPHILEMQVDDLRVQIDHLRIRVTYLRRGIKNRNIRRLELKMSYLKDKAIKQGLESLSISLGITCARFRKAFREFAFTKAVGKVGFVVVPVCENIYDAVEEARIGILECGRAPIAAAADWDDEINLAMEDKTKSDQEMHQQQRRRRRLILDDDDDDDSDEEKTRAYEQDDDE